MEDKSGKIVNILMGYDTLILISMGLFQGILSFWMLIQWLKQTYIVEKGFIIQKSGVFLSSEKRFSLENVESISYKQTIMGKIFKYGTVEIAYPDNKKRFVSVEYPEYMIKLIEDNRI